MPLELVPRMGRPFNDNAVFQQQIPIQVWGWTLPGAEIRVSLDQQKRSAKAGADGRFDVKFDAMPADKLKSVDDAPAGHSLTVVTRSGGKEETKTFSNILIGEVWLCSGQSNMEVKYNSRGTNLDPKRPALRFLDEACSVSAPDTCGRCYSVSYVFGHKLQGELLVPVGLIRVKFEHAQHGLMLAKKEGYEPPVCRCRGFRSRPRPEAGTGLKAKSTARI